MVFAVLRTVLETTQLASDSGLQCPMCSSGSSDRERWDVHGKQKVNSGPCIYLWCVRHRPGNVVICLACKGWAVRHILGETPGTHSFHAFWSVSMVTVQQRWFDASHAILAHGQTAGASSPPYPTAVHVHCKCARVLRVTWPVCDWLVCVCVRSQCCLSSPCPSVTSHANV
jgi:hypothetical protein